MPCGHGTSLALPNVEEQMAQRKIFIEVSGGCSRNASGVPKGYEIDLIDWDNLLGDGADTPREWVRLGAGARRFVRRKYPEEYQLVLSRIISLSSR
jgi:hypothetical protein